VRQAGAVAPGAGQGLGTHWQAAGVHDQE